MTETKLRNENESVVDLRERVLTNAIRIAAVAAPLIGTITLTQLVLQGEVTLARLLRLSFTLLFPLLLLVRRLIPTRIQTILFLFLLLSMTLLVQMRGGLSMSTAAVQLMILMLSALLFGPRGVFVTLFATLCSFSFAAFLVLTNRVPAIMESLWDPNEPLTWLRNGIILTLFGGVSALTVNFTVRKLEDEAEKLRGSLQRELHNRIALEMAEQDREAALQVIEETRRVETLGRMASGIAHDFNNTLTVILTSAEMTQRDPYLSVKSRKYLASIKNSALQAADMTKNLLGLSRKEGVHFEVVDASTVLRDMSQSILRLLPADIEFSIEETTEARIEVDRSQLERALFNMIINARDALAEKGRIAIGCRKLKLMNLPGGIPEGSYLQFWVKDNGRGMTSETVQNLFKPFFTDRLAEQGTGIGMAQVKSFATDAGGKVEVDSELGSGTKVYLYLPEHSESGAAAGKRSRKKRTDKQAADYAGLSLLLVEDNPDVLAATSTTLTQLGFQVATAKDSQDAMDVIHAHAGEFDLMCIDGIIPGEGSASIIQHMRETYPRVKIVVCSGYIEEELILRGIRTGELAFVRKPFMIDELLDTIKTELGVAA